MKNLKNLFRLRVNELRFELKNLEIHKKIIVEAEEAFSNAFRKYVNASNKEVKAKLEEIAGIRGPRSKNMSKAAQKAKQQAQYKAGKTNVEEEKEARRRAEKERKVQEEINQIKQPLPPKFKTLFRDIAKKTHPDILGNDEDKEEKIELFKKAKDAVEKKEYENLIDYALLLDLEIPDLFSIDYCTPKLLSKRVEETRGKVKQITKTVAWGWYHLESKQMKDKLIDNYANYLLKNEKQ